METTVPTEIEVLRARLRATRRELYRLGTALRSTEDNLKLLREYTDDYIREAHDLELRIAKEEGRYKVISPRIHARPKITNAHEEFMKLYNQLSEEDIQRLLKKIGGPAE